MLLELAGKQDRKNKRICISQEAFTFLFPFFGAAGLLGTLIAADSAAWPAWAQLAPTQSPPPISSLTSRQAWIAGGCRQPVTAASRAARERLPLYDAGCGRRRVDALEISNPRGVTCLRIRPGNGVRLPGGDPDDLALRSGSRRAWPRLEPSAHLSPTLPSMPR